MKLFRSSPNLSRNVQEWKNGKMRVLFVGGLSGCGKTTVARQLADEYGAKLVSMDNYFRKLIYRMVGEGNKEYRRHAFEQGLKWLLEDNPEGQLVVEGVQVRWLDPKQLLDQALVIVNSSWLLSTWRACLRDFTREHWEVYRSINPWYYIDYNSKQYPEWKQFMGELK